MLEDGAVVARLDTGRSAPSREERTLRYSDRYVALDAETGFPRIVERTFDELRQLLTTADTREVDGPLAGRTVRLAVDESPTVQAELVGDESVAGAVDAAYLAAHRVVDPVFALVGGAGEKASWAIDDELAFVLLGLVDDAEYFPGESDEKDRFETLLRDTARATGTARVDRIAERDGVSAWVVVYTIELEASSDAFDPALVGIPKPKGVGVGTMRLGGKGEGELWIAREARLPLARTFTFEADLDVAFGRGRLGTEVELFVTHEETQTWRQL